MSQNDDKTMLDPSGGPSKDGAKMKLGPYETTELLGRGGMAVVYKGMQQSLGRVVAIKILPKEFSRDRQFVGRFHREAESVAKLNHPNIIQIIDKGEDKGTCYFVMEYVKGQSLSAKLANKGVTMKELVEIAVQVCSALHYAHEQGVVHRDIKPANILLDETTGVAKVADFGIAQLAEKSTAIGTLTGDHMAMGTLDYMAPEQKRDAKNVDRRADVFSVGVMLYEMATGRVPMGLFDPPSRINKDVPREFDSIVMKCLRDKPTERYQTCQELSSALLALPQNPSTMIRMITSVKSGVTNIGTQIGRRNPAYLAAVLFFVVALGAGSWAAWKYGLKRGGGVASNGGTSGGNNGASSGGNNGGNNGGTQTPKPPDDTAAAEAEKAFRKSMKEAEALLADEKFANALALYDRLLEGATATQRQELLLAKDDAKRQQARWLAEDYGDRLRAAKVDPARADAEAVRRLEELLRSAREADVPQDVLNEISAEVVTARSAAAANAAEAEKKAAEEARRKRFQNALAAARKAIEDDRMEDAERALAEASEAQPTGEEVGEYAAARKAFEDKRSAAATADENAKRLGRLLQEVSDSAKAGKITAARLTLADASALAQALGGEFPEKVKVATAEVDRIEADLKVRGKLQEARDQESANPELAARLYRDAAALMPAGSPERKSAMEKADILDRQVSDAKAKAEYDRHMEAARAAAKEGNWKTAETEAQLALQIRKNDPDATMLVDKARAEANAKPPDKKEVTFTYKNVILWRDMDATSIANDAKGAVFMVDYSAQTLYELDVDAKQKRAIPLKVPASHKLAFDPKGRLYVSTYKYWAIHEVDMATGASLRNFAGKGSEDGKIANLIDFVVAPSGDLFVLDASLYRLSQFGADGAFRSKSGIRFNRDTQEPSFWVPSGLAVDSEGRLYTGDSELHAIKRFKKDGTFDKVFVTTPQLYPGPMVCGRNRLYVADMKLCKILVFSMEGVQIGAVAQRGDLAQQLAKPNGVAIDAGGRVFIADGRKKVVVYEEAK